MKPAFNEFLETAIKKQQGKLRLRKLEAFSGSNGPHLLQKNDSCLNFSSNDYLGLAQHPVLKIKANEYLHAYGSGVASSRLLGGHYEFHEKIEKKLAQMYGTEAALIFNSGFQLNSSVLSCLADKYSLILLDQYCHNSLFQGAKLSQGAIFRYRHQDLEHLKQLLEYHSTKNHSKIFIITESLFSMDGSCTDLPQLIKLSNHYQAILYVDEAHAAGMYGENGMGMSVGLEGIDIIMGTFSKGLGSFGAYICCSSLLKEYLINFCPGFIYTTSLPPSIFGSIEAAITLVPTLSDLRVQVKNLAEELIGHLNSRAWNCGTTDSHIIPLILGTEENALHISELLKNEGIMAPAIRPPTVPPSQSRIRFSLTALHTKDHTQRLLTVLDRIMGN